MGKPRRLGILVNNQFAPAGSLAIDAGNPATPGSVEEGACEATDQRSVQRPQGTSCDIGAYEVVVIAEDTEDPTWSLPADITISTEPGVSTAVVDYTATPPDKVGVVSSSCTPSSGSTFSLGTTTVECTASDAAGNVGTASFTVTVEVNTGSIGTLIEEIKNLDLSKNVEKTLIGPLKNAAKKMEDNNPDNDEAACDKFDEFLSLVQEALADGNITQTQAELLSAFGLAIKDYLNCP